MGAGLCYVELTDVFCSALLAISEFKNAAVCLCILYIFFPPHLQSLRRIWGNFLCVLNLHVIV